MADEPPAPRVRASLAIGRRPYDDDDVPRRDPRRRSSSTAGSCRSTRPPGARSPSGSRYQRLDFDDPTRLRRAWPSGSTTIDEEHGTRGNRLFYLATQPSQFAEIVAQLGRVGLDHERHDGGWRRIVIEKPFGHDLESAKRLNREVGKVFRESQVYRIDHYLGKETVRNLLVFRFGNGIFEPLWNRRYVDHVQITVAESIGIENRGAFYEETGAVARRPPEPPAPARQPGRDGAAGDVRGGRPARREGQGPARDRDATRREVADDVVRGQYGPGWVGGDAGPRLPRGARGRPGVGDRDVRRRPARRSTTGAGPACPFYVRTGKRLPKRATEIAIQFREVPHRLFRDAGVEPDPNLLAIRIQPDEGIMLRFGAKVPGLGLDVRSVTMDFTYGSAFSVDSPDAYETLILDALLGDASLFTRADEVEEAWSIVDPIIDAWADAAAARLPELRRRHVGPARGRRAARPRRPALAADLRRDRWRPTRRSGPASRSCAGRRRAHSIAEIETRAGPDLGRPGPDDRRSTASRAATSRPGRA